MGFRGPRGVAEVASVTMQQGLVWRPETRAECRAAQRSCLRGEIIRVLPGVYCSPGQERLPEVKARAVQAVDPDAVILGAAAARLSWWPEVPCSHVAARRQYHPSPVAGFRWTRGFIPPELIQVDAGLRIAVPALAVLDLVVSRGGDAVDEALRRRVVTLPELWECLRMLPDRRGNAVRRQILTDSRDAPWSAAERSLHRVYRGLGLPYVYRTNHWVQLSRGWAALDFALPELMLGLEADGFQYHSHRGAFERDRERDSDLAARGWQIVRLSASFLSGDEAGPRIRELIAARVALLRTGRVAHRSLVQRKHL